MKMREILFRGKCKSNDEWTYGNLYISHNGDYKIEYYCAETNIEGMSSAVIPETVGQYTGVTDKNGVKIFEGDIVKQHYPVAYVGLKPQDDNIGVVVYEKGSFGVYGYQTNGLLSKSTQYFFQHGIEREIIGNIHDNPELLKGETDNG